MCDVLGVQDPKAKAHAIDLGIGMQLTNIARDVQEDAGMGRRYVPGQWLGEIAPQALSNPSTRESELLVESAQRLLSLAELYYESGKAGLRFLPPRARQGIKVAASVYREIGLVIAARGFDVSAGRAYVGLPRKLRVACRALLSDSCAPPYAPHQSGLHVHLTDLPMPTNRPDNPDSDYDLIIIGGGCSDFLWQLRFAVWLFSLSMCPAPSLLSPAHAIPMTVPGVFGRKQITNQGGRKAVAVKQSTWLSI